MIINSISFEKFNENRMWCVVAKYLSMNSYTLLISYLIGDEPIGKQIPCEMDLSEKTNRKRKVTESLVTSSYLTNACVIKN